VNINVSSDQQIIANPSRIDVAQPDRLHQTCDSLAADRAGRLATSDDQRRDISLHLVHQALSEEGSVNLRSTFHQKAEDPAPTQLVEQWPESNTPLRSPGQDESFGFTQLSGTRGGDQCVRPDDLSVGRRT
jgi:hypothetical protein